MLGLGIDTTGSSCAVALWSDDKLKYSLAKNMNRGYAEVLMPMVDQALLETGLTYPDIDVVGVATGPGSFTGLRVGLSAARGLSIGLNCNLHGVTTFYAAALACARKVTSNDPSNLWVILKSGRPNFFLQKFKLRSGSLEDAGEPFSADESSILRNLVGSRSMITGDGSAQIRLNNQLKKKVQIIPDCRKSCVGLIAELAVRKGSSKSQGSLDALYINAPQVNLARKQMG
ncbi:MAG: tRNA (adenosine(37)-N6)-threonylcarbamoyltransferase complex dimerization subunit type 1 TsaB [Pseudomonadota bacterium]|nr:tRNA (adenosine(37)-N6)-threonylcarbamoyltransferase complex dimerization subunit type 1 TsaB [Pseudomonadota bacterium]